MDKLLGWVITAIVVDIVGQLLIISLVRLFV